MLRIDKNNNLKLTRGDTLTLKCTPLVADEETGEKTEYEPQEGDTFRFAISKGYEGEVAYQLMCETPIELGTWLATIAASETKKLNYETYNYDCEVTHADLTVDTYISGKITITGESK
ncbi:MAG: hypothetical protein IJY32_03945 [Mogibacterium sp.]|nr:hypothetical protein [Mogibacterium sp.]